MVIYQRNDAHLEAELGPRDIALHTGTYSLATVTKFQCVIFECVIFKTLLCSRIGQNIYMLYIIVKCFLQ
jgi:hypothetical protein